MFNKNNTGYIITTREWETEELKTLIGFNRGNYARVELSRNPKGSRRKNQI